MQEARLDAILAAAASRVTTLEEIATEIRRAGRFRWVGFYDVTASEVRIVAFSGPGAPAYPIFSREQGLTGEAIRSDRTIAVGDVTKDKRYLTAFGSTRSEIIVPVRKSGEIVGTIDVESEELDAFNDDHLLQLERVAKKIERFFGQHA